MTRLRVIFVWGGMAHGGAKARSLLEAVHEKSGGKNPPRKSMPEAKRLTEMFGKVANGSTKLFLFREPRGIAPARSRWVQLASKWGIPPRKTKKLVFRAGRPQPRAVPPRRGARNGILDRVIEAQLDAADIGGIPAQVGARPIQFIREQPIAIPEPAPANVGGIPAQGGVAGLQGAAADFQQNWFVANGRQFAWPPLNAQAPVAEPGLWHAPPRPRRNEDEQW